MPSAYDVALLSVPSVRDLRAVSSGAYQLVTMRRYNLPFSRLEIQAHVDEVNELYQPAPLRLHFALALHLMYIVLCQLLRRRDHPEYTKRACCNYRSSSCVRNLIRRLYKMPVEKEKPWHGLALECPVVLDATSPLYAMRCFPISYVHISRCFAAYPLLLVESCPTLFDFRKPMLI